MGRKRKYQNQECKAIKLPAVFEEQLHNIADNLSKGYQIKASIINPSTQEIVEFITYDESGVIKAESSEPQPNSNQSNYFVTKKTEAETIDSTSSSIVTIAELICSKSKDDINASLNSIDSLSQEFYKKLLELVLAEIVTKSATQLCFSLQGVDQQHYLSTIETAALPTLQNIEPYLDYLPAVIGLALKNYLEIESNDQQTGSIDSLSVNVLSKLHSINQTQAIAQHLFQKLARNRSIIQTLRKHAASEPYAAVSSILPAYGTRLSCLSRESAITMCSDSIFKAATKKDAYSSSFNLKLRHDWLLVDEWQTKPTALPVACSDITPRSGCQKNIELLLEPNQSTLLLAGTPVLKMLPAAKACTTNANIQASISNGEQCNQAIASRNVSSGYVHPQDLTKGLIAELAQLPIQRPIQGLTEDQEPHTTASWVERILGQPSEHTSEQELLEPVAKQLVDQIEPTELERSPQLTHLESIHSARADISEPVSENGSNYGYSEGDIKIFSQKIFKAWRILALNKTRNRSLWGVEVSIADVYNSSFRHKLLGESFMMLLRLSQSSTSSGYQIKLGPNPAPQSGYKHLTFVPSDGSIFQQAETDTTTLDDQANTTAVSTEIPAPSLSDQNQTNQPNHSINKGLITVITRLLKLN